MSTPMTSVILTVVLYIWMFIHVAKSVPSIPQLPTRYSAIIEANIIQKNQTWIEEEWYDGPANKAKRIFFYGDMMSVTYEDFSQAKDQLWSYTTPHDDTSNAVSCNLLAYTQSRKMWRNEETKSGGIVSSYEWFQFGGNYTETYLGSDFVIRGISAEGWTRNVSRSMPWGVATANMSYGLTYYFALPKWDWFKSSERRIPIRVELTGTRVTVNGSDITTYDFHHYYDFVQFLADDLMNTEGLDFDIPDFYEECDVTPYCEVYQNSHICSLTRGPPLPTLPNAFSGTSEWSTYDTSFEGFISAQQTVLSDFYYDWEKNRAHSVFRFLDGYNKNAYHLLELLDEEYGGQVWSWMGDGTQSTLTTSDDAIMNCNMFGAATGYTGAEYGLPVMNGTLLSPTRLFGFNDHVDPEVSNETWMGYTTIRGIAAEKWKAKFNITVNGGESTIWLPYILPGNQRVKMYGDMFWYFSSMNWTFAYDMNDTVIPLAFSVTGVWEVYNYSDTSKQYEMVKSIDLREYGHIFSFLPGTPDESWFKKPTFWRKQCAIDTVYCDPSEHEEHTDEDVCDDGLDLPTLPDHKYYAVVEGTDSVNQSTHIVKMWYNYDTNEYRNEYYNGNLVVTTYDDLDFDRRWTWVHYVNDSENMISCDVVPFRSTIEDGNERFSEEYVGTGHVKAASDLWRFGSDWNVTYLGNEFTVRGIAARAWHSTSDTSFTVNGTAHKVSWETIFYFANDSWDYYKAIETADIPLRVDLLGLYEMGDVSVPFNTEMHVVSFFSGPEAFDEAEMKDVFDDWSAQCNLTLYCDEYGTQPHHPHLAFCNKRKLEKGDIVERNDDPTTVYAVMIPVMFIVGLCIGGCVTRWAIKRRGVASFKTNTNAGL
eukprot:476986_1